MSESAVCALRLARDQCWSSRCRCYLVLNPDGEHECICGGRHPQATS